MVCSFSPASLRTWDVVCKWMGHNCRGIHLLRRRVAVDGGDYSSHWARQIHYCILLFWFYTAVGECNSSWHLERDAKQYFDQNEYAMPRTAHLPHIIQTTKSPATGLLHTWIAATVPSVLLTAVHLFYTLRPPFSPPYGLVRGDLRKQLSSPLGRIYVLILQLV